MAKKKIKYTRTELKQQRDALSRYKRYLPTLKLKQQQVQTSIVQMRQLYRQVQDAVEAAAKTISAYDGLFNNVSGLNFKELAKPTNVATKTYSVAGVHVQQLLNVTFPKADYSLFATAPWTDKSLADLRRLNQQKVELEILLKSLGLLQNELKKVMQRVNLFEKVMIPNTMENIRRIRIALGDQMTAGVARAKIAKAKLDQDEKLVYSETEGL
jgi:V/A-type H+/Na+-transporting ATPase subunit D